MAGQDSDRYPQIRFASGSILSCFNTILCPRNTRTGTDFISPNFDFLRFLFSRISRISWTALVLRWLAVAVSFLKKNDFKWKMWVTVRQDSRHVTTLGTWNVTARGTPSALAFQYTAFTSIVSIQQLLMLMCMRLRGICRAGLPPSPRLRRDR
jgi:hypothetical protein